MDKRMRERGQRRYRKAGRKFRRASAALALTVMVLGAVMPVVPARAATGVVVDGDPQEWSGVDTQNSTDSAVAKWAVMQDEDYVYFYIQQNGGNEYGMPVANTSIDIKYKSGEGGSNTQIRFSYMLQELKNALPSAQESFHCRSGACRPIDLSEDHVRIRSQGYCGSFQSISEAAGKIPGFPPPPAQAGR